MYRASVTATSALCSLLSCAVKVEDIAITKSDFCPTGWLPGDEHCFQIMGKANVLVSKEACRDKDSSLLVINSWRDQRELENFIKGNKIKGPVWLDGYVTYSKYRPALLKLLWSTNFFPKINNFQEGFRSPFDHGICVVVDSADGFKWSQRDCGDSSVNTMCVRSRWTLRDYDSSTIQQTATQSTPDTVL